jgi:hypothetical protein
MQKLTLMWNIKYVIYLFYGFTYKQELATFSSKLSLDEGIPVIGFHYVEYRHDLRFVLPR